MDASYGVTAMLGASAALIALSFLAIPMKISTALESDPLGLKDGYPQIFKRFYVQAMCEICLSTSMIFAASMYVVLFSVAGPYPGFLSASLPLAALGGYFLYRKARFFYDYFSAAKEDDRALKHDTLDYIISDDRASTRIECSFGSRLWKLLGLAAVVFTAFLLSPFVTLGVLDFLSGILSVFGIVVSWEWPAHLSEFLRQASIPFWIVLVTLALASVFIDHTVDDRLIRHWKSFQAAMDDYLEEVNARFQEAIEVSKRDNDRLKQADPRSDDTLLREALAIENFEPAKYGLGSLLDVGVKVGDCLDQLYRELDHIILENRAAFDKLRGNVLEHLSSEYLPFKDRLQKFNLITEVLKEIDKWRARSS